MAPPRITAELNDGVPTGERVNRKRVARVMAEHGIAGIRLRRRVRTTVPEPADAKAPDLLQRDFTAEAPNTKYVGDITYLPLADGSNLYLATVIDCCSRKLAGATIADHMRTSLVTDALKATLVARGTLRGAIFHADHTRPDRCRRICGLPSRPWRGHAGSPSIAGSNSPTRSGCRRSRQSQHLRVRAYPAPGLPGARPPPGCRHRTRTRPEGGGCSCSAPAQRPCRIPRPSLST
jgi:hypothetical protein